MELVGCFLRLYKHYGRVNDRLNSLNFKVGCICGWCLKAFSRIRVALKERRINATLFVLMKRDTLNPLHFPTVLLVSLHFLPTNSAFKHSYNTLEM